MGSEIDLEYDAANKSWIARYGTTSSVSCYPAKSALNNLALALRQAGHAVGNWSGPLPDGEISAAEDAAAVAAEAAK